MPAKRPSRQSLTLTLARAPRLSAVGVALVLILLGWFFLLSPAWGRLEMAKRTGEEQRQTIEQLYGERARAERRKTALEKLDQEKLQKISRVIPVGRDVPRLVAELEALASETGVSLKSIAVGETERSLTTTLPRGVRPIPLSVTVSGVTYSATKAFLAALESNLRLLDVQSFSFSQGVQDYTMSIQAYYHDLP